MAIMSIVVIIVLKINKITHSPFISSRSYDGEYLVLFVLTCGRPYQVLPFSSTGVLNLKLRGRLAMKIVSI